MFKALNPVIGLSPAKAAIKTHQSLPGSSSWLGFGRMIWNAKSNEKWTEKYATEERLKFFDTQVWAPDWNTVWKQGLPPDVFLHVQRHQHGNISQAVTLAVREPLYTANLSLIRGAVESVARAAPDTKQYFGYLPWAEEVREWGYSHSFSDHSAEQVVNQLSRIAASQETRA
jgi:hypothetical protein